MFWCACASVASCAYCSLGFGGQLMCLFQSSRSVYVSSSAGATRNSHGAGHRSIHDQAEPPCATGRRHGHRGSSQYEVPTHLLRHRQTRQSPLGRGTLHLHPPHPPLALSTYYCISSILSSFYRRPIALHTTQCIVREISRVVRFHGIIFRVQRVFLRCMLHALGPIAVGSA